MRRVYCLVCFLFFCGVMSLWSVSGDKLVKKPDVVRYVEILGGLQSGDKDILRVLSYDNLQGFSSFVRARVEREASSFVRVLYGLDKRGSRGGNWGGNWEDNKRNVVSAFLGGFLNPDPKVRLFCSHVLLKLGVKRVWVESAVQRALDPVGELRETVDRYYFYTDIYGRGREENIKYSLPLLLELGSHIVLLFPRDKIRIARRKGLFFEWSSMYGAYTYDFYIGDMLYYSGEETFAHIKGELEIGTVEWEVIARDEWGRYITRAEGIFYITDAASATDSDTRDGGQELDFDISDFE